MRLIDVHTRAFKIWEDDRKTPPYAILSHTWSGAEVSMQEYQDCIAARNHQEDGQLRSRLGFQKIDAVCKLAAKRQLSYVWVDTCCIDKASSAELTEAINSMFRWYRNADVCYVHFEDVQIPLDGPDGIVTIAQQRSLLRHARWFTRGWTLQELIAPRDMEFYDKDWTWIGTKKRLLRILSGITGIGEAILEGVDVNNASVATRMGWAAGRHTTRVEDLAYSLLGLFDVNMPLLYGEGERAFKRLQAEILQQNDDSSLFAWQPLSVFSGRPDLLEEVATDAGISVLAQRADEFLGFQEQSPLPVGGEMSIAGGKGVKLEVPLFKIEGAAKSKLRVAVLNWRTCKDDEAEDRYGVVVQKLSPGHFMRHPSAPLVRIKALKIKEFDVRTIYIRTSITNKKPPPSNSYRPHWNFKAGRTIALAIEWYQSTA
jgi:hypothetical protein